MQEDFHYYAAYCAAILAGYGHEESLEIAYADQFADCCTETLLSKVRGPKSAATTQSQMELVNAGTDILGLQNITRIWSSFHFLPRDLTADCGKRPLLYKNKYRLICGPNGDLAVDTVKLAKGKPLPAAGLAMHVLCDTWAHTYFAGTPANVINNTNYFFYELFGDDEDGTERKINFRHNPSAPDDPEKGLYTGSIHQENENSIMNLGHGRAGHLPDYSYIRYKYMPAWGDYDVIIKDNPHDYYHAFGQMVYALQYLRGDSEDFVKETYAWDVLSPHEDRLWEILKKRQIHADADWKAFGEELSGREIPGFDEFLYQDLYMGASEEEKNETTAGQFFLAAMAQKSMVTSRIFKSGNMLAGVSVDYDIKGFRGIKDFRRLLEYSGKQK